MDFGGVVAQSPFNTASHTVQQFVAADKECLYPHQREALKSLVPFMKNPANQNTALIVLPTGCGKSGVAALTPFMVNANRVLVITPSMIVAKQMSCVFTRTNDEATTADDGIGPAFLLDRGLVTDDEQFLRHACPGHKHVKVALDLPSVARHHATHLVVINFHKVGTQAPRITVNDLPSDAFDLVIVDEAHHYPAATWKCLVDHFVGARKLFLTATSTYKGKYILGEAIGLCPPIPPCFELSREVAVQRGIIRPLCFNEVGVLGDDEPATAKAMVAMVEQQLDQHDAADPNTVHKAMILTQSKEGLNSASVVLTKYDEDYPGHAAVFITGTPGEVLQAFKTSALPRTIIVIGRLLEGFDHKPVSVVGIHRNVAPQSKVLFTQFVGRCVRRVGPTDPITAAVVAHVNFNQNPNYEALDEINDIEPADDA